MRQAAHHHDPGVIGVPKQRQQFRRQGEVSQVVGAEVQFKAVGRGLPLQRHDHPGIVHQHLKPVVAGSHPGAECSD